MRILGLTPAIDLCLPDEHCKYLKCELEEVDIFSLPESMRKRQLDQIEKEILASVKNRSILAYLQKNTMFLVYSLFSYFGCLTVVFDSFKCGIRRIRTSVPRISEKGWRNSSDKNNRFGRNE